MKYQVVNTIMHKGKEAGQVISTFENFDNVIKKIKADLNSLLEGRITYPYKVEVRRV